MKTRYYIVFILTVVFTTACEDYLDRPPLDQIDNNSYWRSTVDLKNYTAQYYQSFPGHQNSIYTEGLEANDDITFRDVNVLLNGQTAVNTGTWTSDFSMIRSVNLFFDNYQNCEDDFTQYQHYLGEAQFFKAWFYFGLVQKYGDVPWFTHALTPEDEAELQQPRDPRTTVVDSILSLLDDAVVNLDLRDEADWNNNSVNKEAALAFKSRVALHEGTWQKYHAGTDYATPGADPNKYFQASVDAAEELMNGDYNVGIYSTGNPDTDYFQLFGTGDMGSISEILLYRAYNINDRVAHNQNYYTSNAPNQIGATWSYVTTFLGKDGEPLDYLAIADTEKGADFLTAIAADADPRLKQSIWIPGDVLNNEVGEIYGLSNIFEDNAQNNSTGFQIKKNNNLDQTQDYANANDAGYILLSYSEVILNYAEALYELEGTVAYDQLNMLRARVGMPDFTINAQSSDSNPLDYGYTISDELYEIRRERRVEKAFEQIRQDDWKRWAAASLFKDKRPLGYPFDPAEFPGQTPSLNEDGLMDVLQNDIPSGYQFRTGQDYLSSVPLTERTLNPNLTQNPGW